MIVNPDIREIREQQNVTLLAPGGKSTVRLDALTIWWSGARLALEMKYREEVEKSGIQRRLHDLRRYAQGYAGAYGLLTEESFSLQQYENAEEIISFAGTLSVRRCQVVVRDIIGKAGSVRLGDLARREDLDNAGYQVAVGMLGTGALSLADSNSRIGVDAEVVLQADYNLRLNRFFGNM